MSKAVRLARQRFDRAYAAEMAGKTGFLHEMRFIWSGNTLFHEKRSWLQRLFRW